MISPESGRQAPSGPRHVGPQPLAAVLAFAFPGAGHWALGHRDRAVRIAAGVLLLFFTGLFVGGVDAVDRRENGLWFWFYGQMWNGPLVFGVDYLHQTQFKVNDGGVLRSARPNEFRNPLTGAAETIFPDPTTGAPTAEYTDPKTLKTTRVSPARPPKVRSVGKTSELGTLFIAVGGMLNLIAIIDATFKPKAAARRA